MAEKIYNLSSFTDEERERIEALINQIEEEKKNKKKWWIVPNFDIFEQFNINDPSIKVNYFVEEQKDSYSKSRPPLKSDFNSKEEAERWLAKYISENSMFNFARDDLNDLILGLDLLRVKLNKHEKITQDEWEDCFRRVSKSVLDGDLHQVIEWNENVENLNLQK